jgi:bifunctional non-homologous end joining protein LigD
LSSGGFCVCLIYSQKDYDHRDFLFELKQDGFRCLAYISESRCDLVSRRKYSYKSFDSLKTALAKLRVTDAILDGEICCLDSQGRSQFNELLYRRGEPVLYCFDLLWLNGQDLRQLPLIERKKRLHHLIAKSRRQRIIYAQHIAKHGTSLYREICERDLEGVVAKRKESVYSSTGQWLKVLNPNYTQHEGRHEKFTAFKERSSRVQR